MTDVEKNITTHQISLTSDGPVPVTTNAGHNQEVAFTNNTEVQVTITFDHPGIFSPSRGGTLKLGSKKTKVLKINQIKQGTGFSYTDSDEKPGPRSGRIDPL